MSAQPFDRPLDRLLELLRENGLAYRCRPALNMWTARCPMCGEHRLDVTEHGFGGRVSVRCALGCDADEILNCLKHPERCFSCGAVHGQAAELSRCAGALLDLAHEQQTMLRSRLVRDDQTAIAA